jgi:alkanesulfonate monooxygenase SsuD/methylene tetrahydromethanopterin reductase-like flavin-dependent oxidoreductase (luciferase family)
MSSRRRSKKEEAVRLGVFMMPLHRAGRPMYDCLAEDTEKALLMDELGFDELFIGEHFSAVTEPYPAPLMFAASLLSRTKRLVFGTGVINAPLRHPAFVAAEAAQFDHLSKGRFILGIGSGSTPSDNEMIGVSADPRERGKMLLESIEMIEKIWASDPPYDLQGEYWNTRIGDSPLSALGFGQLPKPFQKPGPPIAIPSSTGDSPSVQAAGRKGWSVISGALLPRDDLAKHWQLYRKGCAEAGRPADGGKWRVCRTIFVAPTDQDAYARAFSEQSAYRHFFGHMHGVFTHIGRLGALKTRPDMRDDEVTIDTFLEQRLILGSPETVLNELLSLRRQVGPFGTLILSCVDWEGRNAAWETESWTLLANEVMPALREQAAFIDAEAQQAAE